MRDFIYGVIQGSPVLMFPVLALIIFTLVYSTVLTSALRPKHKERMRGMAALPFSDDIAVSVSEKSKTNSVSKSNQVSR